MNEHSPYARAALPRKQMHYSPNLLSVLNNAIDNRKLAAIEYDSPDKGVTHREIEPLAIVFKERRRQLVAWCRLRNDYRSFRLDRMSSIKLKQEQFSHRQDFKIEDFQDDPNASYEEAYEAEN